MRYVLGALFCISVLGLLLAVFHPQVFRRPLGKRARTRILVPFFVILSILSLAATRLLAEPQAPKAVSSSAETLSRLSKAYQKQLGSAPTTGKLTYQVITPLPKSSLVPSRITVLTPEKTAERLIAINDEILQRLKADNLLTDRTVSFFIDYFDDKKIANSYFSDQSNKSLSLERKQDIQLHYAAVYIYNKEAKTQRLFHLVTSKVIKDY